MRFPEVTLQGNSYEIGEQIGRFFKAQIRESLQHWMNPEKVEQISILAQQYRSIIHSMDPSYMKEIEGIQAGAGLAEWEALYLHSRWEINEVLEDGDKVEASPSDAGCKNEGCSTFAFSREMTSDANVYCGTNHDVSVWSRKQVSIIRMLPSDGPRLFMLAYPGSIALDGMNEHGLSLCGNSLYGINNQAGKASIPHGLFKRMLLRQQHVKACIELARRLVSQGEIGFSGNFTVCDASGDMACLELINGCLDVILPQSDKSCVVHTNHLQSQKTEMLAQQGDLSKSSNTVERLEQMNRLVGSSGQEIDLGWIQTLLTDHEHYPRSICSHVSENYHTAYSLIMLPKSREAWITAGNPCENRYYKAATGLQDREAKDEACV
ncbi:C45 family autoproteolytic acyltransferase/hydolase [Paenibacillus koleovorans]|uniref:C45 family autoproteolytic acyltransferase/hydolase n=1 Tax=Paenibacillus koleovorans TaxID=121608 RepID=UPI000FDA4A77|nr:C45 family peptidase [Paenibacillus koleovorans]